MRVPFRRKRVKEGPPSHDEAVAALKAIERDKVKLDRFESNPNAGYNTPDNSVAGPGAGL